MNWDLFVGTIAVAHLDSQQLLAGRFVLEEEIHRGPMTVVFRALDVRTRSDVAVKVFAMGRDANEYDLESFRREVESLRRVQHPNVVRLLENGETSDHRAFVAIEWAGRPFRVRDSGCAGNWFEFYAAVGKPVLSALNAAHMEGITHRDVKPSNILIDGSGVARLADFNIASLASHLNPHVTLSSFGTVPFVPPEPDEASRRYSRDCYAFAVVAISAFVGRDLRSRDDVLEALRSPDLHVDVRRSLSKATHENPLERHSCAAELLQELDLADRRFQASGRAAARRDVIVRISDGVLARLEHIAREYGIDPDRFVEEELAEVRAVTVESAGASSEAQPAEPSFYLWCRRTSFLVRIDSRTHGYLVAVLVRQPLPHRLIEAASSGWRPSDWRFVMMNRLMPRSDPENVARFQDDVGDWHNSRTDDAAPSGGVVERLRAVLEIRERRFEEAQGELEYRNLELIDEDLAQFEVSPASAPVAIDDALRDPMRGDIQLGIYDIDGMRVIVRRIGGDLKSLPRKGHLELDRSLETVGLRREQRALQLVADGRNPQPELRSIIESPQRLAAYPEANSLPCPELKDGKQQLAVHVALSAPHGAVIQGPPGTGKTRVIGAIVRELLAKNGQARVLLASQTHVAVDNALEELIDLGPGTVIRLGDPRDPSIDSRASPFLVQNVLDKWLCDMRERADEGIARYASEKGWKLSDIELRLALVRSVEAKALVDRLEAQVGNASANQLVSLPELLEAKESLTRARADLRRCCRECGIDGDSADARERLKVVGSDPVLGDLARIRQVQRRWQARAEQDPQVRADLIARARVVCGTCIRVGELPPSATFDLAIVDEASKATITETLVPLSRCRRWVLVGDSKQLPPHLDDLLASADESEATQADLAIAQRSLLRHVEESAPRTADRSPVVQLTVQRRMAPAIGDMISHCFYESSLESVDRPSLRADLLEFLGGDPASAPRVVWLSTSHLSDRGEQCDDPKRPTKFWNMTEAKEAIRILSRIAAHSRERTSIMCVAGYSTQVDRLRGELQTLRRRDATPAHLCEMSVHTIDSVQGQEADVVLLSVTRSNSVGRAGFLRSLERINVALSRARELLLIIGDDSWVRGLSSSQPLREVLRYIEHHRDRGCAMFPVDRAACE